MKVYFFDADNGYWLPFSWQFPGSLAQLKAYSKILAKKNMGCIYQFSKKGLELKDGVPGTIGQIKGNPSFPCFCFEKGKGCLLFPEKKKKRISKKNRSCSSPIKK